MAKKKVEDKPKIPVDVKDLKIGDLVYLTEKDSGLYTVLDVGTPFILIEDTAHFAYLYRVTTNLWKDKEN